LLVRGVVGEEIMRAGGKTEAAKNNWVLFSGTLSRTKGVAPLIKAWPQAQLAGWELHIAGDGEDMASLKQLAAGHSDIIFHGILRAPGLAELTSLARICINPHDLSRQPGNVFATKIVEYLAAGAHVISTPMGAVEKEIAAGMTFMPDNTPETIARTLQQVVRDGDWRKTAQQAVLDIYRPEALRAGLDNLMRACVRGKAA
jgi:glycosyltransferase involved in cell wall biosynthesis